MWVSAVSELLHRITRSEINVGSTQKTTLPKVGLSTVLHDGIKSKMLKFRFDAGVVLKYFEPAH